MDGAGRSELAAEASGAVVLKPPGRERNSEPGAIPGFGRFVGSTQAGEPLLRQ